MIRIENNKGKIKVIINGADLPLPPIGKTIVLTPNSPTYKLHTEKQDGGK